MPQTKHHYNATITWTGDTGVGTSSYQAYERSHEVKIEGKPIIQASADPAFRGDKTKYNPEELLLASVSSCHMLWYLHLCAEAGVVVMSYEDKATGTLETNPDGSGRFTEITLHPEVTVSETTMLEKAMQLHQKAHQMCFIAQSLNFPVTHKPHCRAMA